MGPKGEIFCCSPIGHSDRRLCGTAYPMCILIKATERERHCWGGWRVNKSGKENCTKEAQVFPMSKQVNGLTLHRSSITVCVFTQQPATTRSWNKASTFLCHCYCHNFHKQTKTNKVLVSIIIINKIKTASFKC